MYYCVFEKSSRLLVVALLTTFLFISCKKADKIGTEAGVSHRQNDYSFLHSRLRQFANEFIPVLTNKTARNFIVDQAKLKFDEEYEVLINDLFKYKEIFSLVPVSVNESLHDDLHKRSGQRLYPQIYIPRLQYLEDYPSEKHRTETAEFVGDTIYVFYSGDPEVDSAQGDEIYPGYKLVNGQFQYYTMVDEDYANEHEVWVLSLNETVNEFGRPATPCEIDPCAPGCPIGGCGGGGGGGGGGVDPNADPDYDPSDNLPETSEFPDLGHLKINFKIEAMRVRAFNERWLAGASEISIRAKLVCHNGRKEGIPGGEQHEYFSDQKANKLGKLIRKFKRKEIKNVDLVYVNYPLQSNWQCEVPSIDPVHFVYVIFERDIFPATEHRDKRYAPVSLITNEQPPSWFKLYWRSQDKNGQGGEYAKYYFTNTLFLAQSANYAGSGLVENGMIAFNTVLY